MRVEGREEKDRRVRKEEREKECDDENRRLGGSLRLDLAGEE